MGCVRLSLVLSTAILISAVTVLGNDARVNKSTPGLFWSTAAEEGDFFRTTDSGEPVVLGENDEPDSGLSFLDAMLQWVIGHLDPSKLEETAQNLQRQEEIQGSMKKVKRPYDAELMKIAIDNLNNSFVSMGDRLQTLEELLLLVEPIENANDLGKLGGLDAVVKQLDDIDPDVRKLAAWILGKITQNNPTVQQQVLELGTLAKLINMVKSDFTDEATTALYAVSAAIRNNFSAKEIFYAEAGDAMLRDILSNSTYDVRLRRNCVFLAGALGESLLEGEHKVKLPMFSDHVFLNSAVNFTPSEDLDLEAKALAALIAMKTLHLLRLSESKIFTKNCGMDRVIYEEFQRTNLQLHQISTELLHRSITAMKTKIKILSQRGVNAGFVDQPRRS